MSGLHRTIVSRQSGGPLIPEFDNLIPIISWCMGSSISMRTTVGFNANPNREADILVSK